MVMVLFISVDFFFFITNINSTFPLSLAWLFRVNTPAPNSLPRPVVVGKALEFTLTDSNFFGGTQPSLTFRNNDLPYWYTLVHERGNGAIKFVRKKVCILNPNLGCKAQVKGRWFSGSSVEVLERDISAQPDLRGPNTHHGECKHQGDNGLKHSKSSNIYGQLDPFLSPELLRSLNTRLL